MCCQDVIWQCNSVVLLGLGAGEWSRVLLPPLPCYCHLSDEVVSQELKQPETQPSEGGGMNVSFRDLKQH